jgi:hypothetical protein
MTTKKFSERVDFTYFIGAGVSLILINTAIFFYNNTGSPMIFALVSFFTYVGVLVRGLIDHKTWGKTQNQMKISAFIGFASIFVIFSIDAVLLLTKCFNLSNAVLKSIYIFGGISLCLLFIFLYTFWFRNLKYELE